MKLDTSLDMNERGKSAYSRSKQSFKESKFGQFVQHVESGRVPPGSYLLVESVDRLTREEPNTGLMRLLHLLSHDIRIITLSPVHREYGKEDQLAAIQMWAECMRAHEESRMKSERVGSRVVEEAASRS